MNINKKLKEGESLSISELNESYQQYNNGKITLDQYRYIINTHRENKARKARSEKGLFGYED